MKRVEQNDNRRKQWVLAPSGFEVEFPIYCCRCNRTIKEDEALRPVFGVASPFRNREHVECPPVELARYRGVKP